MSSETRRPCVFDKLIQQEPKITVLSDNPISLEEMTTDIFNFGYHLGPIYDIIRHPKTQMPLTIGVYGKWGTGKTTAMRWLDDALMLWKKSPEPKDKVTTRNVWFYPWKYHDKEDIWRGLISEVIIEAIDVKNASATTVIAAVKKFGGFMGRSFLHVLDNVKLGTGVGAEVSLGAVKEVVEEYQLAAHPEKPFLNEFEETLKEWLKNTLKENERMVVFIDDLDRCMPDIALQVLEAIKLYLKIDKLIFVIGMDRVVVEKAVRAYCKDKQIDIDGDKADGKGYPIKRFEYEKQYLDKMFQVDLHISPSRGEIDKYLDKQLNTVDYKKCIEEKDDPKKERIYKLFRDLILKYGGRNPREIKRLINSSLTRGAGAEKIPTDSTKLTFEQGVQIFFIQKILADNFGYSELVGDGDVGDQFFSEWSRIVRENDVKKGFKRTAFLPKDYYQELQKARTELTELDIDAPSEIIFSLMGKVSELENLKGVHKSYDTLIKNTEFRDLVTILLSDKDLGDLMQIKYSTQIAEFSKQQKPDSNVSDDEKIITNTIAKALKKDAQDLTENDYITLKKLVLSGIKISNLAPLEKLTNLSVLELNRTQVSNLAPLENLTKLSELNLAGTQVSDLTPLANLTNLSELILTNTPVSDLTPLANLTNLSVLYLVGTPVLDLRPLTTLKNLSALILNNTQVSDLTFIAGLPNLFRLGLSNTPVSDLTPLENLTSLSQFIFSNTPVSDLRPLEKLTSLSWLSLEGTQVSDLRPLERLTSLSQFIFSNTPVSDLTPLAKLTNLTMLSLDGTQVSDLTPLAKLTSLIRLRLRNTPILDIDTLKGLQNLKELLLEGCEHISDEQIDDLQNALPNCIISRKIINTVVVGPTYRLHYNPKAPGLSKAKIMRFGEGGKILEGQNKNELSWRIRYGYLELLNSEAKVFSRFYYEPEEKRFNHTNDPDTLSIKGQFMVLE